MKLATPYIQSLSGASTETSPFHFASAKPSSVAGSSSRLTLPVLKPTTQRLARSLNQRRCDGIAQGGRSAREGLLNSPTTCSRASASTSGALVSTTSTLRRPPRASVSALCDTFSLSSRQSWTLTPYCFSKAWASGPDSVVAIEV